MKKKDSYFQCGVLYTTASGQRRLRIHTAVLSCTSNITNLFRMADTDAVINVLARKASQQSISSSLKTARDTMLNSCVNMLYVYRKHCASTSNPGQLILPEALKLLPIYTLALQKSSAFRFGTDVLVDERMFSLHLLNSAPIATVINISYPHMYDIRNLPIPTSEGQSLPPKQVRTSIDLLDPKGAFLLDNSKDILIWLGNELSQEFLFNAFNIQSLDTISSGQQPTIVSPAFTEFIDSLRTQRGCYMNFSFIKQRSSDEPKFLSLLVEDKTQNSQSYVDFLCVVHRQIQLKMS